MSKYNHLLIIAVLLSFGFSSLTFARSGLVQKSCKDEIAKYCPDKEHVSGAVRTCIEANKDKVSDACKKALDNTGRGHRRKGRGTP